MEYHIEQVVSQARKFAYALAIGYRAEFYREIADRLRTMAKDLDDESEDDGVQG